jgi:hypothetical protein
MIPLIKSVIYVGVVCSVTVQNSAANLTLTATCVAAVVFRVFRRIPFTHVSDFSTHNSSRIQKATLRHSTGSDDH